MALTAAAINLIWDELTAEARTAGSYGQLVKDNVNATIASRAIPGDLMGLVADAITAAKIATDAIGASEFSQAAADKVWGSAARTLTALGFVLGPGDLAADTIGASELGADAVAEIRDAVLTGATLAELPQAAPPATPTLAQAMMLLYMAIRNLLEVTATEKRISNDAGTIIAKKALSDDGTTFQEAEMVSGP
jgi:hypothetical protein